MGANPTASIRVYTVMSYGPKPSLLGKLTAEDFPEENSVTVVTKDGSVCRYRNAFYHRESEWIAVYSEKAGYHMFRLKSIGSIKGLVRTDDDKFALL